MESPFRNGTHRGFSSSFSGLLRASEHAPEANKKEEEDAPAFAVGRGRLCHRAQVDLIKRADGKFPPASSCVIHRRRLICGNRANRNCRADRQPAPPSSRVAVACRLETRKMRSDAISSEFFCGYGRRKIREPRIQFQCCRSFTGHRPENLIAITR